jgi:DNA-binding beta-propeller fold protein YncE
MIAVDRNSNLYVVDQYNHRIQKFDAEGRFLLTWGQAGSGAGQFNYPFGIAIDSRGDVYVSDMNNQRVQKFSAQGKFVTMLGRYGAGESEFKFPYGVAIDANDILYVLDTLNYRVQKFDRNLKFQGAWDPRSRSESGCTCPTKSLCYRMVTSP